MRHPASRHRGGRLCEPARPAAHRPSALGSELACPHPFACSPAKSPAYPVMSPAHLLSCPAAHLLSYPPAQLPTYSVTHLPGCLPLSCPPTHPPTCSCAHLLSCPHAHHSVAHLFPCPPTLHPLVFSEFSFAQLPACCLSPRAAASGIQVGGGVGAPAGPPCPWEATSLGREGAASTLQSSPRGSPSSRQRPARARGLEPGCLLLPTLRAGPEPAPPAQEGHRSARGVLGRLEHIPCAPGSAWAPLPPRAGATTDPAGVKACALPPGVQSPRPRCWLSWRGSATGSGGRCARTPARVTSRGTGAAWSGPSLALW